MPDTLAATPPAQLIRNEPMQARSTARLAALLDAAAAVVADIGYERLTTAMVAEGASASIGTVYRYFPDRIAVLQSLAARNEERITTKALEVIEDESHADWRSALSAALDVFIEFHRDEPGFTSLRLGDVINLRPAEGEPRNAVMADALFAALAARFDLEVTEETRAGFESAFVAADALLAHAFARDPQGDEVRLEAAKSAAKAIMAQVLPA